MANKYYKISLHVSRDEKEYIETQKVTCIGGFDIEKSLDFIKNLSKPILYLEGDTRIAHNNGAEFASCISFEKLTKKAYSALKIDTTSNNVSIIKYILKPAVFTNYKTYIKLDILNYNRY